ncbi:fatty acyl-CoA reductase 2-like [Hordeum vulgare]|nr:fatty acyl-CoA reductase 2-like [Hordeum vulgare]
MDWLPPIGVSRISDGGKVIPHKELFLIQSYSTKSILGRKEVAELGRGLYFIDYLDLETNYRKKTVAETNPDVGKIYVLIKAKDNEAAMKRLKNEVEDTELFRCLQEIHGKNYHSFVLSKQVPVVGNFREANIGIAPELAKEIAEEVDVIVNSAANTTFDERYDVALDINTVGPFRIMSFAQRFRRLKLFLQVSTAYVNGQRQGLILEKPFCLGDTITKGIGSSDFSAHQNTVLDIEAEIKLAFYSRRHSSASASVTQEMKELGSRESHRILVNAFEEKIEALESSSSLHSSQDANDNQNGANEEEITST